MESFDVIARRSISPSPMIDIRAVLASTAVLMSVTGCGQSTPVQAPIASKPNVIVTLDGKSHACVVALYSETTGNSIACADVAAFVRDELRLPKRSIYDIRTIAKVDDAEVAKVGASLKGAGYRYIGGPRDDR
jgi:uncharacterized metal-binding protein